MDLSHYTALFVADGRDHLKRATAHLLEWEQHPDRTAPVDGLFRAFHSLKSSAATMGYADIAELTHRAENLLEAVRRRELTASAAVVGLLFETVDVLDRGIEPASRGEVVPDARPLAEAIERLTSTASPAPEAVDAPRPAAVERKASAERAAMRAVRVDPARLDELLQLAGELVVTRNRLTTVVARRPDPDLEAVTGQLDSLIRALHGGVLRARLAPITELFGRFPRVVRDLGTTLGKTARLELLGEGIELDRTMLEELVDPLIHLLRNAVDHGLETPEERLAAGKPAEGRLVLAAERRRDWIAIRLSDDGRGVDREAVLRRAVEQGLVEAATRELSDDDVLALLARPAFTVKREVTAVSGRGVGMDAVVSKVRTLGGRVGFQSTRGQGTAFELTVPLTTAIQRVLLVEAGGDRYGIPSRLVREATVAGRRSDAVLEPGGRCTFRGRPVPFVDLTVTMTGSSPAPTTRRRPVLFLEWGTSDGALAVDTLLGQHDVLLERFEAPRALPAWVSGATILADGAPAFVLDPTALFLTAEAIRND